MKTNDIIHHKKYLDFLQYKIEDYNNRPAPGNGLRWKRTPYDGLKDMGIFTPVGLTAAFCEIAKKQGAYSSNQRRAIVALVLEAIQTFNIWMAKNQAKADELKALKSPCENCALTGIQRECLDDMRDCRAYCDFMKKQEELKPDPEWEPDTEKTNNPKN